MKDIENEVLTPGKKKKVMGNRKKLDANKDGKLTRQDFAMLRKKKRS